MARPAVAAEIRFWRNVGERAPGQCWIWKASVNRYGYGQFHDGVRAINAHRWAYERFVGAVPEGLQLDHLCRNRRCVNPAHLEAVTVRENLMRGETHAARNVAKTHCPAGHEYAGANLRVGPDRRRYCRTCIREKARSRAQRLAS